MLDTTLHVARTNTALIEWLLFINPFRVSLKTVEIPGLDDESTYAPPSARARIRKNKDARRVVAHWIGCDPPTRESYESENAKGVDPELVRLYFHGGGYTVGSAQFMIMSFTSILKSLKKHHPDTRVRICAIDYPLAPEAAFPEAINSAVAAYRWLLDQPGIGFAKIALGGDSASGGLALALFKNSKPFSHAYRHFAESCCRLLGWTFPLLQTRSPVTPAPTSSFRPPQERWSNFIWPEAKAVRERIVESKT